MKTRTSLVASLQSHYIEYHEARARDETKHDIQQAITESQYYKR